MNAEGFARLAFEAHYDAGHPAGGGWGGWSAMMPDGTERAEWLAVGALIEELARKAVRDASRTDEAEPRSEPRAAAVIVVEREDHPARLFAATGWEVIAAGTDAGDLVLAVDGDEWVAQIGARHWDTVCKAEAILPADLYERQGRKLAIALDALRDVRHTGSAAHTKAQAALDRIAELDL